jgi:ribosome-associated protein
MTMDSRQLARRCRDLAENRKAENLVVLDVRKLTSITDFFVIASGTSEPHLRAIMDETTEKLREENGLRPRATDGSLQAGWMVLDYNDVIVHIMRAEVRQKYDLEALWSDAPRLKLRQTVTASPGKTAKKKASAILAKPLADRPRPATS